MSFGPNTVDDMWSFEDFVRRVTQKLFDPALPDRRIQRNRAYRLGLLQIMDGLQSETPFDVVEGMDRIAAQFPRMDTVVHKTPVEMDIGPVSSESE
jgi:hypothetical protein